ncbi:hypothetical protein CASFOL_018554 [Castilleja foliolosa]|uniref:Photosystem II 10 kDa polypeptide, chloroplastic n=1 Tax=Castilleja foliolosa TaxID=1961234 RepID=A0ABD3D535_9LAMI
MVYTNILTNMVPTSMDTEGKSVYQYTDKYGANVDGYREGVYTNIPTNMVPMSMVTVQFFYEVFQTRVLLNPLSTIGDTSDLISGYNMVTEMVDIPPDLTNITTRTYAQALAQSRSSS